MFAVIYTFDVKSGRENEFENSWSQMTHLIQKYEGGLGSRLHKRCEQKYLAYAQWPDKKTWENAGNNLPPEANEIRITMNECCSSKETLFELDMIKDLLSTLD